MMAVAYFMAHCPNGPLPIINKGELAVVYCFVFLYIFFRGGGPWSLDAIDLRKENRRRRGWRACAIRKESLMRHPLCSIFAVTALVAICFLSAECSGAGLGKGAAE